METVLTDKDFESGAWREKVLRHISESGTREEMREVARMELEKGGEDGK